VFVIFLFFFPPAEWSNVLSNDDLFGEDDLGFDPFHETQKALAEMIESESKQVRNFKPLTLNFRHRNPFRNYRPVPAAAGFKPLTIGSLFDRSAGSAITNGREPRRSCSGCVFNFKLGSFY
jgi:hypothetical protein